MGDKKDKPRVFLSSVFEDVFEDKKEYVPLRKRIIENKNSFPVFLWAYEIFWPDGTENPEPDADTVIDRCFEGIRDCDLFIFLLTKRHGEGVRYFEDPVFASYLELELFAAAVLRKPVLVLHLRGHEPEPALRDLIVLLNRTYTANEYVIDGEKGLFNHFQEACERLAKGIWTPSPNSVFLQLPDWLSIQRTNRSFKGDLSDPRLLFLNGRLHSEKRHSDPDKAKLLLDQVTSGIRFKEGQQQLMPNGSALFRLWAAMRELMDEKETTLADPLIGHLWDRALGLWGGKASWFGLHGHLWLGPLAAINSQTYLRKKFAKEPDFQAAQDVREPVGAKASAIYSIAKQVQSRQRKFFHFRQTVFLANRAIDQNPHAQHGALSIRGHALMRMAQLGHYWRLLEAKVDFKRSLELRELSGAPPASIGEAKTDLGFCSVLTGRFFGQTQTGLALLQEGVMQMREDQSVTGKDFLARGLRKLEQASLWAGQKDIAEEARNDRLLVIGETGGFDRKGDP